MPTVRRMTAMPLSGGWEAASTGAADGVISDRPASTRRPSAIMWQAARLAEWTGDRGPLAKHRADRGRLSAATAPLSPSVDTAVSRAVASSAEVAQRGEVESGARSGGVRLRDADRPTAVGPRLAMRPRSQAPPQANKPD